MPAKTTVKVTPATGAAPPRRLVLASTSRYRKMLLERLGLPFIAVAPGTDETALGRETPAATAFRLSEAKARSVAGAHPRALIIGSDQVADCDGRPIGKPGTHERAVAQLTALSGQTVVFHTGLCLLDAASGQCQTALVDVRSTFRFLGASEIEAYLRRERPYDCAGSVRSEALGIALFERIESDDPTALIGLPLIRLTSMLRAAGVAVPFVAAMTAGRLILVPNLLGAIVPERVLPAHTIDVARTLAHYVVENAKPARAFLRALVPALPIQEIGIVELGDAPEPARCSELLAPARNGLDMGLMSDAGCPGIADPGALLVREAHRQRIAVVPLVGPSSIVLALMASGMNGQGFVFHGYLPVKADARIAAIQSLEAESARSGHAQIFIETPYRNGALLTALAASCKPATRLCVAADLTLPTESVVSQAIREWRGTDGARYARRPAIFVLQA